MKKTRFYTKFRTLVFITILPLLVSCIDILETRTLQSIAISPTTASIEEEEEVTFSATATYTDGSTGDITSSVDWHSSNTSVASISDYSILGVSGGKAKGLSPGTTTITATKSDITSNEVTLTVRNENTTTIYLRNQFKRKIVYEIWSGDDLYYENGQVVGYGEKLYPTGPIPEDIDWIDASSDGLNDVSADVKTAEEVTSLLFVIGVPYDDKYYYLTDETYINFSSSLYLIVCDNGTIDQTTDTNCSP